MSDEYTCAACGETFKKGITDEEAMEESVNLFGELPEEDLAIVCDDCFKALEYKWLT